jgi:predicted site-specific integrase-resolvase
MKNNEEHVNLITACELLGICKNTLWNWEKKGLIEKIYIGLSPRIKISEINRILKK